MTKTEYTNVRLTPAQRQKIKWLAAGMQTTISGVLCRLIDEAPVESVKIEREGFVLSTNKNAGAIIRQDARTGFVEQ